MANMSEPTPREEVKYRSSERSSHCRAGAGYDQFIDCELSEGHSGKHRCGSWEW